MTILVLARQAQTDLRDIADYIARDNPDRAVSFVDELLAAMELIRERPTSFRLRSEWRANLRSSVYHGYQIIFQISGNRVEIARVLHGSRDIPSQL
ncbi:MAG: type II toxin-antitoxin system RelE/ParE family toxin [Sphingomonadales bacterium]|nr:type II toxin-antitoxin system RelE/ParE family toxin [Sphingomonadales bacterium]